MAMDRMFKKHVKSEYVFYLQEDWEFERTGIDIDRIIYIMNKHKHINSVLFNKYRTTPSIDGVNQNHVVYENVDFCTFYGWAFLPGIWRVSKFMEKWKPSITRPEGNMTQQFGTHEQRTNPDWAIKNMGVYWYGKHDEPRWVKHLGNTWRMAEWRLENGKPGGMVEWDIADMMFRAKWLGPLGKRPINPHIKGKETHYKKLLDDAPVEWKKELEDVIKLDWSKAK